MESTDGDRNHRSLRGTAFEAREILRKAVEEKAKILVPVFAIGRTQLLLDLLAGAVRRGTLPKFPIDLDSPMAIEATRIYGRNVEILDEDARKMLQSRALNGVPGPCMILAGSGMCSGGRILHHLRHNLDKRETAVRIVGYQSPGSLGRRLVHGEGNRARRFPSGSKAGMGSAPPAQRSAGPSTPEARPESQRSQGP